MDALLRQKMNRFREVCGDALTPEARTAFLTQFSGDEIADIRVHIDSLRPQVVNANPQPLHPDRPIREVPEEVLSEYYFFRPLLDNQP